MAARAQKPHIHNTQRNDMQELVRRVREYAHRPFTHWQLPLPRVHCAAAAAPLAAAADAADTAGTVTLYQVFGWPECPWFLRASCIASELAHSQPHSDSVDVRVRAVDRSEFGPMM